MIEVILAASDLPDEPALVSGAMRSGVRVTRRCVDAVDLLATSALDPGCQVVVSPGLPRLTADAVERIADSRGPGVQVVGLAGSPGQAEALRLLGVPRVVTVTGDVDRTWRGVTAALRADPADADDGTPPQAPGVWPTRVWESPAASALDRPARSTTDPSIGAGEPSPGRTPAPGGRLIAVWGPVGAPGRTTVALGLAESIADAGRQVCLVDADTYGPSLAMALDLIDEGGGLLRACRQAEGGQPSAEAIRAVSRPVRGRLRLIGGIARPERWTELRGGALDRVWQACRSAFDVTVVDAGFCLEHDDGPAAFGARRNAATLTAIAHADLVIAVADGSAAGAARLVEAWPALASLSGGPVTVVRNRAGRADAGWTQALCALGVSAPVQLVPADVRALRACWARGRTLSEGARRSRLRRSLTALAADAVSG